MKPRRGSRSAASRRPTEPEGEQVAQPKGVHMSLQDCSRLYGARNSIPNAHVHAGIFAGVDLRVPARRPDEVDVDGGQAVGLERSTVSRRHDLRSSRATWRGERQVNLSMKALVLLLKSDIVHETQFLSLIHI